MYLLLEWGYAGTALTPIPSSRLFCPTYSLSGCPFRTLVLPTLGDTTSILSNVATVMTGGVATSFTIAVRDKYGNPTWDSTVTYLSRITPLPVGISRNAWATHTLRQDALTYIGSVTPTYATATAQAISQIPRVGGLWATYFDDPDLNYLTARASRLEPGPMTFATTPATLTNSLTFSVRWAGFIRTTAASLCTFTVTVNGADEKVRLWVDNSLVVDSWTSANPISQTASISFAAITYYDIMIEYTQDTGGWGFQLEWTHGGGASLVVTSDKMYTYYNISGSPQPVYFTHAFCSLSFLVYTPTCHFFLLEMKAQPVFFLNPNALTRPRRPPALSLP